MNELDPSAISAFEFLTALSIDINIPF